MAFLTFILAIAVLPMAFCAEVWVYSAGSSSRALLNITRDRSKGRVSSFCGRSYGVSAISIFCIPSRRGATEASFFIGRNRVNKEGVLPYTIAGDYGGSVNAWRPPSKKVLIKCVLNNGEEAFGMLRLGCKGSGPAPSPAGREPPTPPTTDETGIVTRNVGPSCISIPMTDVDKGSSDNTIWKNGASDGMPNCLTYKYDNNFGGIFGAGTESSILAYKFRAPASGTYLVTVIMRTNHGTEHNDIFMKMEPGGFTLVKAGSSKRATGPTKGYHNRNGFNDKIYSVDFNAHTFTTELSSGAVKTLFIYGRSTKVAVCGIMLFPCTRSTCYPDNTTFKSRLSTCKAMGSMA